ncbi:hypothetical protein C7C46_08905 [Streptomyces tateyamensis]|uniref:Uncharacterized protein n=1 Tax=Streptomyces tateyamensis TaxID=565073 RepID=A0A2V4NLA1_9ACTN|nr:hypothetical protein [Streptomyces tateyamensis]PYC83442.1 hypothetical protein C7C46_08905 [Streptomyces tateyamensis]
MAGMGPAPKPAAERRRRNVAASSTRLPAAGRPGPPPAWPLLPDIASSERRDAAQRLADELELQLLEPDLTGRARTAAQKKHDAAVTEVNILTAQLESAARVESELWAQLWATPQAVAWERLRWDREVAQYVRWKVRAEQGDLDAAKEARQLADRLGLNPLAMLRLRWEVADDEVAEQRQQRAPAAARTPRQRLRVVGTDAVEGT